MGVRIPSIIMILIVLQLVFSPLTTSTSFQHNMLNKILLLYSDHDADYGRRLDAQLSPSGNTIGILYQSWRNPFDFIISIYSLVNRSIIKEYRFNTKTSYYRGLLWIDEEHILAIDRIIDVGSGSQYSLRRLQEKYPTYIVYKGYETCEYYGTILKIVTNHKGIIAFTIQDLDGKSRNYKCTYSRHQTNTSEFDYTPKPLLVEFTPGLLVVYNVETNSSWTVHLGVGQDVSAFYSLYMYSYGICFSPDGKYVALANSTDILIYDLNGDIVKRTRITNYKSYLDISTTVYWIGDRIIRITSRDIAVFNNNLDLIGLIPHPYSLDSGIIGASHDGRYLAILLTSHTYGVGVVPLILEIVDLVDAKLKWYSVFYPSPTKIFQIPLPISLIPRSLGDRFTIDTYAFPSFSPDTRIILVPYYNYTSSGYVETRIIGLGINGELLWETPPIPGFLTSIYWINSTHYMAEYLEPRRDGYYSRIAVYHRDEKITEYRIYTSPYSVVEKNPNILSPVELTLETLTALKYPLVPRALLWSKGGQKIILLGMPLPSRMKTSILAVYDAIQGVAVYAGDIIENNYGFVVSDNGQIWILSLVAYPSITPTKLYDLVAIDPRYNVRREVELIGLSATIRPLGKTILVELNTGSDVYWGSQIPPWYFSPVIMFNMKTYGVELPFLYSHLVSNTFVGVLNGSILSMSAGSIKLYMINDRYLLIEKYSDNSTILSVLDMETQKYIAKRRLLYGEELLYTGNGAVYLIRPTGRSIEKYVITMLDEELKTIRKVYIKPYNSMEHSSPGGGGEEPVRAVYILEKPAITVFKPVISPNGHYIILFGLLGYYHNTSGLRYVSGLWGLSVISLDNGTMYLLGEELCGTNISPSRYLRMIWSPGDRYLAVYNSYRNRINIYRITRSDLVKIQTVVKQSSRITNIKWMNDNSFIVYAVYSDRLEAEQTMIDSGIGWTLTIRAGNLRVLDVPGTPYLIVYNYNNAWIIDCTNGEQNQIIKDSEFNNLGVTSNLKYIYVYNRTGRTTNVYLYDLSGRLAGRLSLEDVTGEPIIFNNLVIAVHENPERPYNGLNSYIVQIFSNTDEFISFARKLEAHPGLATLSKPIWLNPFIDTGIAATIIVVGVIAYYLLKHRRR